MKNIIIQLLCVVIFTISSVNSAELTLPLPVKVDNVIEREIKSEFEENFSEIWRKKLSLKYKQFLAILERLDGALKSKDIKLVAQYYLIIKRLEQEICRIQDDLWVFTTIQVTLNQGKLLSDTQQQVLVELQEAYESEVLRNTQVL